MDQFRTNLVVSGTEPFAEDSWKRIRIGEVEFEAVKPCERCILTTVEVKKGRLGQPKSRCVLSHNFVLMSAVACFSGKTWLPKMKE